MQLNTISNISNDPRLSRTKSNNPDSNELDQRILKKYIKRIKESKPKKQVIREEFSVYGSNFYARLSNQMMSNLTFLLTNRYPDFFNDLYNNVRSADIKMYSKTYVSVVLFTTIISFPIITIISLIFFNLQLSILIGFLGMVITLLIAYLYPNSLINDRRKKIKYELVFAIVHMASIAESGAKPISMFRLLLESKEYKYLETDLKKIINYVNLFGYSLTTSLRTVASSSSSYELKELLNGIIATVESGGDLKSYLKDKANDALIQYKLDQDKYSSRLSTYSDLYTGILIAAPLLFLVTFAILEKISPNIGGISIVTLATAGTYFIIPLINVLFILFLNITKLET